MKAMKKEYDRRREKENIEFFKERVRFYQKYLGLLSFKIDILPQIKPEADASAILEETDEEVAGKRVTIAYSLSFVNNKDTTTEDIDEVAFHEACEILLSKVRRAGEVKNNKTYIDGIVHEVIRTLENTLFEEIRSDRTAGK